MGTLVTDLSPVVLAQHGQAAFLPLVPSQMGWVLLAWERGGGGGQWVGGLHCRKRAGTTSCSGFKRKCLAASPISHPLLPSSLGGGSQLRARLLSLGGCQAALPAELHPSAWFPWKRCSPHEILACIFAPNPVPNPLGLTSQELFSSKEYRSGSGGPPWARDLPAGRWQLCNSRGEPCCRMEWIRETQTFPLEIPPAPADFPWLQERGIPPGSVSGFFSLVACPVLSCQSFCPASRTFPGNSCPFGKPNPQQRHLTLGVPSSWELLPSPSGSSG